MEISQAVQVVAQHIRNNGAAQMPTIRQLWPSLELSAGDLESCAQDGFQQRLQRALSNGIGPNITPAQAAVIKVKYDGDPAPRPAELVVVKILFNTCFRTATGEKPLIRFTVEDIEFCKRRNTQQIIGLRQRNDVLDFGAQLLTKHKAAEVSELPPEAQQQLAEKWMEVAGQSAHPDTMPPFKQPLNGETSAAA